MKANHKLEAYHHDDPKQQGVSREAVHRVILDGVHIVGGEEEGNRQSDYQQNTQMNGGLNNKISEELG